MLEIKRIPYGSRLHFSYVDFNAKEFPAGNPRVKDPAFADGEFELYEPLVSLDYMDVT